MRKLLWALGVCLPTLACAQAGLNTYDLQDISRERPFSSQNLNKANAADLARYTSEKDQASHYYLPQWLPGTLTGADGIARPVPALRYNMAQQWVEVQDASVPGKVRVYPADALSGFELRPGPGEITRFGAYQLPRLPTRQQLQELTPPGTGPLHLLVRHEAELQGAVRNAALNIETQPAQVLHTTRLYVASVLPAQPRPTATELPLNEKQVFRLFGADAPMMADYTRQQHLSCRDPNDVLKLVEHYNQLRAVSPTPSR